MEEKEGGGVDESSPGDEAEDRGEEYTVRGEYSIGCLCLLA